MLNTGPHLVKKSPLSGFHIVMQSRKGAVQEIAVVADLFSLFWLT